MDDDGIAIVATFGVVVMLAIELYSAATAYREGRLELRQTDFLSRMWSAVSRGSKSLWKQLRYVPMKKMHLLKKESESERENTKPSLRGFAMKVKASVAKGHLSKSASASRADQSSSRPIARESSTSAGRGWSKGRKIAPKKLSARTMSAMLVR